MKIRTTQPKNNKYYIRKCNGGYSTAIAGVPTIKGADVLCNCVGYAGSRFNELLGQNRQVYALVCNAEDFIESAKRQGLKISSAPVQGGIMVWAKGRAGVNSDGAGHVAVVEEVYEDGSILTSESGWNAWAFKTVRRTNDNGRWGQGSAYRYRGCIINPAVTDGKVAPTPKLTVDGVAGTATIRATQQYFGTPQDGVLSGQNKSLKKYYPNITAVEYGKGGSACVKKLQKWCGVTVDGVLGEKTIKAWQKKIGVSSDGVFGANSVRAWQQFLNKALFTEKTEPTKPSEPTPTPTPSQPQGSYRVIDVSDWQSQIDWSKVKQSGVVGAIIRYADGTTLDKRFDENMRNAKAAGLHIGSYIFSRAKTKAEAEKEAERLFNACKPYAPDMPLYIDLEVASLAKYANTVAQAFLNKMVKLGGRGGVYANLNWWNNYLADTAKNYSSNPFWIAQYNDKMTHKNPKLFGMWQYSSSGNVDGIKGRVDMDVCYIAYWDNAPKADPPKEEAPTIEPPKEESTKKSYEGALPELGKNAKISALNALILACEELAFPYGTPTEKTKYLHKKSDKVTKYDSDRPTKANKIAFDRIFPQHWTWGSVKYGYGQRTNACCDDAVSLLVRYAEIEPKFSHSLDTLAKGTPTYKLFDKAKYTSKSQLKRGAIVAFKRKDGSSHIFVVYDSGKKCDAGLNDRYLGIRNLNKSYYDFTDTVKYGYVYMPKTDRIDIARNYLCFGMVSDEVTKLQKYLVWYGYPILIDGIFGAQTLNAVKDLQTKLGVTVDGKVGINTLDAMAKVVK